MKVSILIPVYNIEGSLEETVRNIYAKVKTKKEIIIVWDVMKPEIVDETKIISEILEKKYGTKTFFRIGERGFGSAIRMGFEKISGDSVVIMMGDLCDDPKTIDKMVEKMNEGYDVVCGSRYTKGGGIIGNTMKQRVSSFVSSIISAFSMAKSTDLTNAFKLYRREVLKRVKTESNSFDISLEIPLRAARAGFKISEVPTVWKNRSIGESKFNFLGESKNYFHWFLFSTLSMPSNFAKAVFLSCISILLLLFLFLW